MCFMETHRLNISQIRDESKTLRFPSYVCVLLNEYNYVAKSFKYDYWAGRSVGR